MDDISDRTGRFFGGYAEQFDEIYALQRQRGILGWLNRRLRASMLLRYERTFDALRPLEGRSVLDIGCGSGRYVGTSLARGAARVVGIDLSEEMLELARRAISRTEAFVGKANFVCDDFLTHTFDERYDYGIVMGVMDYIEDAAEFVGKLSQVIRGKAALSFPVAESIWALQRKIRYRLRKCPLYFYERDQLERLLAASPFATWSISRIRRDYFVVVSH